jgi:hypothetical protein
MQFLSPSSLFGRHTYKQKINRLLLVYTPAAIRCFAYQPMCKYNAVEEMDAVLARRRKKYVCTKNAFCCANRAQNDIFVEFVEGASPSSAAFRAPKA